MPDFGRAFFVDGFCGFDGGKRGFSLERAMACFL
jgi:hypothetical protein